MLPSSEGLKKHPYPSLLIVQLQGSYWEYLLQKIMNGICSDFASPGFLPDSILWIAHGQGELPSPLHCCQGKLLLQYLNSLSNTTTFLIQPQAMI